MLVPSKKHRNTITFSSGERYDKFALFRSWQYMRNTHKPSAADPRHFVFDNYNDIRLIKESARKSKIDLTDLTSFTYKDEQLILPAGLLLGLVVGVIAAFTGIIFLAILMSLPVIAPFAPAIALAAVIPEILIVSLFGLAGYGVELGIDFLVASYKASRIEKQITAAESESTQSLHTRTKNHKSSSASCVSRFGTRRNKISCSKSMQDSECGVSNEIDNSTCLANEAGVKCHLNVKKIR